MFELNTVRLTDIETLETYFGDQLNHYTDYDNDLQSIVALEEDLYELVNGNGNIDISNGSVYLNYNNDVHIIGEVIQPTFTGISRKEFRSEMTNILDNQYPTLTKCKSKTRVSYQYKGRNVLYFDNNDNLILSKWIDCRLLTEEQGLRITLYEIGERTRTNSTRYSTYSYSNHLIILVELVINRIFELS